LKELDVNVQDELGFSPLWWACFNGHLELVEILLKAGANPNIEGFKIISPLIW
jgi:ankyrin repeat protein